MAGQEGPIVPGCAKSFESTMLDRGASLVGDFRPISQIRQHFCAFHFYSNDMTRQVEAHHYCTHVNEDVHQCVIYDSSESNARLIGIEYIISRELFQSLPDDEKRFWHSHDYEVTSGELYMPNLPLPAEQRVVEKLCDTYGKTFHTWQVDRGDALPLGPPQLMMSFTEDSQISPNLIESRDERCGKPTSEVRASREHIKPRPVAAGANHWSKGDGKAWQTTMEQVDFKGVE